MNKGFGIILTILVGVAAGLFFLSTITTVVHQSMLPLGNDLRDIHLDLAEVKRNLAGNSGNSETLTKLAAIENRLKSMEDKIASGALAQAPKQPMPPSEDFNKVYTIDIGKSYVKGKKDAPVTIVAFTDLQCPFCSRFHGPFQEALKAYPDKVNFVIKNFPLPFHQSAKPAAKAALAAGEQGKYFEMVDALLENQKDKLNDEGYKELAKSIGLNVDKFLKDFKNNDAAYEAVINNDLELVNSTDVRGTPTFFINGKKTMARDLNSIKTVIDKALEEKGVK